MIEIIEKYKNVIIQISTPHGSGTGFYLKENDLIVTNEHVVRGSAECIIDGSGFEKALTEVLYTDTMHDLAFLKPPKDHSLAAVELSNAQIKEGDAVMAIGHPYGLKYTATQGIISKAERLMNNINFIQVDAAINPGNSGGPLVSDTGHIVGVNSAKITQADNLGFALPMSYLKDSLDEFAKVKDEKAVRCGSCGNVVTKSQEEDGYCPHCGARIEIPDTVEEYTTSGVAKEIEALIVDIGKDLKLSRRGKNSWEFDEGSATIRLYFNENSGFIIGDAHLCRLPKTNIKEIYEYLLRENNKPGGLVFSSSNQNIVLSFIIYQKYFNLETGKKTLEDLAKKADYYDHVLVDDYGALWIKEEQV